MNSEQLFGMALGLHSPWQVDSIEFKPGTKGGEELHLTIGFARGSRFADASGQACPVHDTVKRTWQHLNFFEHACYLHCQVPRIKTSDGRVETVSVPWARPESGFTLLFEALAMALIEREMPVKRVAKTVKAHWTGIVRFIESRLTNGLLEGINHKIQLAKRRANGYRNVQNFINMAYFLCGKLDFSFARRSPA